MSTTARVTMTIRVVLSQPWSNDEQLATVFERARREAEENVRAKMAWAEITNMRVEAIIAGEEPK